MTIIEQLGIEQPFIQAPLIFYPNQTQLVISVSDNGGLGVLSADHNSLDDLKKDLELIKQTTEKPFAVCLDTNKTKKSSDLASQSFTNALITDAYKALNLKQSERISYPDYESVFNAVISFKPKALIFRNGLPTNEQIAQCERENILVIAIVSNLLEAITADHLVDIILLQGVESAGPISQFNNDLSMPYFPCSTLLFHAIRHINKPLIVWGDYQYPEQFVSAFINGASAVMTDIPFWSTKESTIPNNYRQKLKYHNEIQTVSTYLWSGDKSNCIDNQICQLAQSFDKELRSGEQKIVMRSIMNAAIQQNQFEYMPLWAGFCANYNKQSVCELMKTFSDSVDSMMEDS